MVAFPGASIRPATNSFMYSSRVTQRAAGLVAVHAHVGGVGHAFERHHERCGERPWLRSQVFEFADVYADFLFGFAPAGMLQVFSGFHEAGRYGVQSGVAPCAVVLQQQTVLMVHDRRDDGRFHSGEQQSLAVRFAGAALRPSSPTPVRSERRMWGNDVGAHAIRPARSPSWPGLLRARWHAVRIRADRPSRIVPQRFPATISTFSLPVRAVRRTHRPRPYARCLRPPSPRLSCETRQRRPRVRRVLPPYDPRNMASAVGCVCSSAAT